MGQIDDTVIGEMKQVKSLLLKLQMWETLRLDAGHLIFQAEVI